MPNPDDDVKLQGMVQRMIDAKEPPEKIKEAIQHWDKGFKTSPPVTPPPSQGDTYKGPDTFWGGVKDYVTSGDVLSNMGSGALGYLKGATIDLPSSIAGGLESIGNFISHPIETAKSIPGGLSNMWDTATHAGGDPESFGRMMGQVTGQPLTTAGIMEAAPYAKPYVGKAIEPVGRTMRRYQPISGFMPRIAEMRTLRNIERVAGGKLEEIGQRMQVPTRQGQIVNPPINAQYSYSPTTPPSPTTGMNVAPNRPALPPVGLPAGMPLTPPEFIDSLFPGQRPGLPPASGQQVFQMPEVMDMGTQSPTAGSHMNSPAEPHGIPPAAGVETPIASPQDVKVVPKKALNNTTLKHMSDNGYQLSSIDEKGNYTFRK